jgi:hypothetical protein
MAAGSWRTGAGLGDANIAVARRTIAAALNASEKNRELLGHPVMQSILAQDDLLGPLLGELGVSFGLLTVGTAKMAATVEGTDVALTNYSLANSTTITPARHAFARAASDFGRALQEPLLTGELAPDAYAMVIHEAMMVWANTLVDKIVALFPSLTNTIGTTATDLSWSAIQNGIIDHKDRGNRGPVLGIIDSVGAKDLMSDMLSLGGAVQWAPQAQGAIQNATAGAYLGRFWEADFYLSGELDNDGTDTSGALISMGCIATKHARVPLPSEAMEIADGYWFTVEGRRTAGSETRFDIVSHLAAQIREDGRGSELLYGMT